MQLRAQADIFGVKQVVDVSSEVGSTLLFLSQNKCVSRLQLWLTIHETANEFDMIRSVGCESQ